MTDKKPSVAGSGKQLAIITNILKQLHLVWLLFRDGRIPVWVKSVLPLAFLYLISPIDFVPDVLLGVGQLDDLGVVLLGLTLFVKLCPPHLVDYYRHQLEYGPDSYDGETIDATYRVIDND